MEWSFKRALTVQTYCGYDPIPVPLNIIYRIFIMLRRLIRGKEVTEVGVVKIMLKSFGFTFSVFGFLYINSVVVRNCKNKQRL